MEKMLIEPRTKHSYDDAYRASVSYFDGNELAAKVFLDKYALRDHDGDYVELTPEDMHVRLASEFARVDENYGANRNDRYHLYLDVLRNFQRVVPQGSPMAAIGNPYQVMSASNCVVVGCPGDSMEGIIRTGEALAQLMKRRCGVGLDISTLRPKGMRVNNAAKTTSGATSFADFFSYVTRMVCQSGRRGALMITMDVHHPDIAKFISAKLDPTMITGANISVKYSDEFMQAVEADDFYEQRWPLTGTPQVTKRVRAKEIWDLAVECATKAAEPGCLFWDTITRFLPAHDYPEFETISCNPCSEISLSPFDACRLISINLTGYIRDPFSDVSGFDWEAFKRDVRLATRMSDNLVDLELEYIERIMTRCDSTDEVELWRKLWKAGQNGRRVGLGTHGLGDTMMQLGIKYDSDRALVFVDSLYEMFRDTAYDESINLAIERGPFPSWDWEVDKDNAFINRLPASLKDRIKEHGRRNIAVLTQAPTGTVSLCSKTGPSFTRYSVTSGVEPLYAVSHIRRKKTHRSDGSTKIDHVDELGDVWQEFEVVHSNVLNYLDVNTDAKIDDLPDFFVEADDIDWRFRVALQGVEQKYIDHSISSTINLPKGTKPEVVSNIYFQAWKHELKGVTVYIDGSRDQILRTGKTSASIDVTERPKGVVRMQAPKRPKELPCDIHHTTAKGRKYIAIVGLLKGEPYEFFGGFPEAVSIPKRYKEGKIIKKSKNNYRLHVGKNGDAIIVDDIASTFSTPEMGWTTRLISAAMRHGTPIDFLVEQLSKSGNISDFNRVIGRVLKKYIKNGQRVRSSLKCPECDGTNLVWQDCLICMDCGYTLCQ